MTLFINPHTRCRGGVWVLGDEGYWEKWDPAVGDGGWRNTHQRRKKRPDRLRAKNGRDEWRMTDDGAWELWTHQTAQTWRHADSRGDRPTRCECGLPLVESADGSLWPSVPQAA